MGDHGDEAWDDLLFNPERYEDEQAHHYADSLSYLQQGRRGGKRVRYSGLENRFNIMTLEPADNPQPEFHLLHVTCVHRESQLAYLVTGTVEFDPPFRGVKIAELREEWIPKSRCLVTGYAAQIPHWLLKKKMDYPNIISRAPAMNVDLTALKSQAIHVQKLGRAYRPRKNPFGETPF